MRKRLVLSLILALLILTGCGAKNTDYKQMVSKSLTRPLVSSTNRNKKLFKYYVLPDVGVKETTELSTLLEIGSSKVLLTLNVSDIISKEYYDQKEVRTQIAEANVDFQEKGIYVDASDVKRTYVVSIKTIGDKKAIMIENGLVTLIGVARPASLEYVFDAMMVTMRSVDVDEKLVVASYSNKEEIDTQAITEEFFRPNNPESGSLEDLYYQMHPNEKKEETGEQPYEDLTETEEQPMESEEGVE